MWLWGSFPLEVVSISPLRWIWTGFVWPTECGESEVVWVCKPWSSVVLQWSTERDGSLSAWGSGSNPQETVQLYTAYSVRLYDNRDASIKNHSSQLKWSRIRQPQPSPTAKHMREADLDCPPSHPASCAGEQKPHQQRNCPSNLQKCER